MCVPLLRIMEQYFRSLISQLLAVPALKFQAPNMWESRRLNRLCRPSTCRLGALDSETRGQAMDPGTRLGETAIRKMRTDKSTVSVHYGLEIPKAPVLVTFSAGNSPTVGNETRKRVCSWAPPMSLKCEPFERIQMGERDTKSDIDLRVCLGQCHGMTSMAENQGNLLRMKSFSAIFSRQDKATAYIRSTGVRPNRRMPLAMTCRAASYNAIRAFCNSGSLPTILR